MTQHTKIIVGISTREFNLIKVDGEILTTRDLSFNVFTDPNSFLSEQASMRELLGYYIAGRDAINSLNKLYKI